MKKKEEKKVLSNSDTGVSLGSYGLSDDELDEKAKKSLALLETTKISVEAGPAPSSVSILEDPEAMQEMLSQSMKSTHGLIQDMIATMRVTRRSQDRSRAKQKSMANEIASLRHEIEELRELIESLAERINGG